MDDASADLILGLQFEDLLSLDQTLQGDTETIGSADSKTALDLYRDELRHNAVAIADHPLSERLGEPSRLDSRPPSPVASPTPTFDQLLAKSLLTPDGKASENGTSSSSSSSEYQDAAEIRYCTACNDGKAAWNVITAPCGDQYCKPCIIELFALSLKDESLFPPRCCKESITLDIARPFLNDALIQEFLDKRIEHETVNKTYCSNTGCAKFIPASSIIGEQASCRSCGLDTCSVCKAAAHEGDDCPEDPARVQLMEAAKAAGYQTCNQCKRMVELDFGCNHMTCLCRAEFCYVCGNSWKSCDCPQWDEARLLARRTQIVAREPVAPNAARILQIGADLRDRHECAHGGNWRRVTEGSLQCEMCRNVLATFLHECRDCHLRACYRCRHNRL